MFYHLKIEIFNKVKRNIFVVGRNLLDKPVNIRKTAIGQDDATGCLQDYPYNRKVIIN